MTKTIYCIFISLILLCSCNSEKESLNIEDQIAEDPTFLHYVETVKDLISFISVNNSRELGVSISILKKMNDDFICSEGTLAFENDLTTTLLAKVCEQNSSFSSLIDKYPNVSILNPLVRAKINDKANAGVLTRADDCDELWLDVFRACRHFWTEDEGSRSDMIFSCAMDATDAQNQCKK